MTRTRIRPGLAALVAAAVVLAGAPGRAEDQTGALDVCAFGVDGPLAGVELVVGARRAVTGADGTLRVALPPGQHEVVLRQGERVLATLTVPVVWGESTELLVAVAADGGARVEVEAAAWPRPEEGPPRDAALATGELAGRVVDARDGSAVVDARVLVRGQLGEARTDARGAFRLGPLPAGPHAVSVIHPRYATGTFPDVHVPAGGAATLEVGLSPSSIELETVRVSGYELKGGLAALLEERRDERQVTEVLGAEQIGKSGDSNAAEALQRVTGLTVVGGRHVYVRGMGERYALGLLNGATLPSADPDRRVVPFDLFPADVIESLTVQKSYSPDLPGEFGGGAIRIKTKGIPRGFGASVGLSTGFHDRSFGEDGLSYSCRSDTDWMGFDDGARRLPIPVAIAADREPLVLEDPVTREGYPLNVLTSLGQVMPNQWSARPRRDLDPDLGFSGTIGDRYETPLGVVGFATGASYDQKWRIKRGIQRVFGLGAEGRLEPFVDYRSNLTTRHVDASGLAALGWEPAPGQSIRATTLLARTATDQTETYGGYLGNEDRQIAVTSLDWTEEQLLAQQLQGSHLGPAGIELEWSYTYALATRDQPDWRRTRYDLDPALRRWLLSNRPEGNQRLYNEVDDDDHDLSAGLDIPFAVRSDEELHPHLRFGGGWVLREREARTRRFKFIHRGERSRDPEVLALPPEGAFGLQNLRADGFSFEEITRATDQYTGAQTITAGWVDLTLPIVASLSVTAGVRLERSAQVVETFDLFSRTASAERADLATTDWLPAASLVWRFTDSMQLRGGYGRSLARPDFRELSTAPFDQVIGAGVFIGNPDLDRTTIDAFDVRWEWYLSEDEAVSVGLFYKELKDPIETVILGGSTRTVTLENAARGRNVGIELEGRKRLSFIDDALAPLFVGGNVSLIRSEVQLDSSGVATNEERPLHGQSEWVVNASFGWDDPETRTSLVLLYNVSGERLVGVGTFGLPDIMEQPFHALDLVASWGFHEGWTVRLQVENLLGSKQRFEQGGETAEEYTIGSTISLSLTARF